MQLVGVAGIGARLLHHLGDRLRGERADAGGVGRGQRSPQHHRPGPPLLERGVVEERPGLRPQDLVGQRRGLGQVACQEAHLAGLDAPEEPFQPRRVHGLSQAVAQGLLDERVVGRLDRPGVLVGVVLAGHRQGEDRGEQVVGAHAGDGGRHLATAQHPRERQRAGGVPAPADGEHGGLERRLREHLLDAFRGEHLEDRREREGVLRPERQQHAVVAGGGLQLEVEGAAEALAEREPEGAVLAGAERGVEHELHAARLVEEALGDERLLGGQGGEHGARRGEVVDRLARPGLRQGAFGGEPPDGGVAIAEPRLEVGAKPRDLRREGRAPPRRLAEPEGDARGRAARVLDPDHARLDAPDAPGGVAEQEDVAGHALHREVLVHLPDRQASWLRHHLVLGVVGDGAAPGERGDARAAPPADHVVHAVPVEERPGSPAAGGGSLGEHRHDGVELPARELAVGPGPPDHREELVLPDRPRRRLGHDLLGEHVERPGGRGDGLERSGPQAPHQRRALDELVAAHGEEACLRRRAPPVSGPSGALQRHVERPRAAQLGHQVHRADVDAELERRGGDDGPEGTRLEPVLRVEPPRPRQAAVVGGHLPLAEPLGERVGGPLGELAGVHEHEGGPVLPGELREPVVGLGPLLLGGHRGELVPRDLHAQVEDAPAPHLDDGALRGPVTHPPGAHQEAGHLLDRAHRGREADALGAARAERLEPLEREGEVAAALVAGHGVDLVDDHLADRGERPAPLLAREEQVERLGGGDENVGRALQHGLAARRGRVPGADRGADGGEAQPCRPGRLLQGGERLAQVLLDVVREGLERRDVEDAGLVGERPLEPLAEERVETGEEGGEGLARPRGRGDQDVAAGLDLRPARGLRLGGGAEAGLEPARDQRVEAGEHVRRSIAGGCRVPGPWRRAAGRADRRPSRGPSGQMGRKETTY